jgi:hypothetical protein
MAQVNRSKTQKVEQGVRQLSMFERLIDRVINTIAPDKSEICSIRPALMAVMCTPMILLTDTHNSLQLRTSSLLTLNIVVRLLYPSSYFPASASTPGFLASPVTARCIAFVAEFCLYEIWATWVGVTFWGSYTYLWLLVLIGESISTLGLLLQNDFLLKLEDSIWAIHTLYMSYLSYPTCPGAVLCFSLFGLYFLVSHLPIRFKLLFNRVKNVSDLFKIDPLYCRK